MAETFPTPAAFLAAIKPFALTIEKQFGIPWLFCATQAAHESRNGNSKLTQEANNLFGVTGESWQAQGKPVYIIKTKEFDKDKRPYFCDRPFRKYAGWGESLQDWASLILRHYPVAYQCATHGDAMGFFDGLKAGGYATDPQYAEQLKARYAEFAALPPQKPLENPPDIA